MSTAMAYRPQHHPDESVLMDFAAGAAREAGAVLIATHLALCPPCRDTVQKLESLGGALIEDLPPSALPSGSLEAVMARLDEPAAPASSRPRSLLRAASPAGAASGVPSPLRDYLGADLGEMKWHKIGMGVAQVDVPVGRADSATRERMRLLRISAGAAIPRHTHRATEMVLVLSGGFRDGSRRFLRGDFALSDQHVDHQPIVDKDADCFCLSVTDGPVRFTGPLGRILNLFVRF
jgi:putative transcriptional regulator